MYKVDWDDENNLLVLKNENAIISNECRPVFSDELKNLGFDSYISFDESEDEPVLWAIKSTYYYKGKKIAELVDNGCLKCPSVRILDESILGKHLPLIDVKLWISKNQKLMDQLVQDTLLRIYGAYIKYEDNVDYIYVAYSGGKDSMVLLDLVKRIIPHDKFFVCWIDSGMELKWTLDTVQKEMERCRADGIMFLATKSIWDPVEAWNSIGPPSFDNRWCCSVLQSVPNTIELKAYLGKKDAKGMVFLGNRADESSNRRKSSLVNTNAKHVGQMDVNGIINWSSLEVYLYLFMNAIEINPAYKKGIARVGCILCPRASNLACGIVNNICRDETKPYYNVVRSAWRDSFDSEDALDQYINLGEWKHRTGAGKTRYNLKYQEKIEEGILHLEIKEIRTRWTTWIKTLGVIRKTGTERDLDHYVLSYHSSDIDFSILDGGDFLDVYLPLSDLGDEFVRLFKIVFRKASTCIGCLACQTNCPYGHLSFVDGKPEIDDGCLHCGTCHHGGQDCYAFVSWFDKERLV